jgi:hypothetical protein
MCNAPTHLLGVLQRQVAEQLNEAILHGSVAIPDTSNALPWSLFTASCEAGRKFTTSTYTSPRLQLMTASQAT